MEEKFLYYLGAGSSANALPIVKAGSAGTTGLAFALDLMAKDLRTERLTKGFNVVNEKITNFINDLATKLEWLAQESRRFGTVDTYAKYLHLIDKQKLEELKFALSSYFTLEQIWNEKLDNRYLVWLISILNTSTFPDNIKILSWNYDFQLQLTAEIFRKEDFSKTGSVSKHTPPLIKYYPAIGRRMNPNSDEVLLFHLNGVAGFFPESNEIMSNTFLNNDSTTMENVICQLMANKGKHRLNFAWENDSGFSAEFAPQLVQDTTIMIIIGYSFPFFNREIDKAVFGKLKESGKLKKIYFQDPNLDGSFLKNQFNLGDVEIIHIDEVSSFYIPFEL